MAKAMDKNMNVPVEMVDSLGFDQKYDVEVPADSEPAILRMNTDGDSMIMFNGKSKKLGPLTSFNSANPQLLNPESKIRISNVGKTNITDTLLDVIVQVTEVKAPTIQNIGGKDVNPLIIFGDGSDPRYQGADGGQATLFIGNRGNSKVSFRFTLVKSGTDEPVKVTTAMYFSDIDYVQGIEESFSNQKRYYRKASMNNNMLVDPKNNAVYDINSNYNGQDPNDMRTPEYGTYVGVGTASTFEFAFYQNYKATEINGEPYERHINTGTGSSAWGLWGSAPSINLVASKNSVTNTYFFKDKNDKEISSSVTNEQTSIDADSNMVKQIFGYSYVETIRNGDNTFTVVYEPRTTTSFVDESGNEIKPSVNDEVEKSEIDGYDFIETKLENNVNKHIYRKKVVPATIVNAPNTGVEKTSFNGFAVIAILMLLASSFAIAKK